jgi:glycosidase
MQSEPRTIEQRLPRGVMLNAYPDSLGGKLSDLVALLKRPEFDGAFSLLYVLPTFFNSDLDRGFSIVDYGFNQELVAPQDLDELDRLGIAFKFDLILNHPSVASPQFRDLLERGDESEYKDFFLDWNAFWGCHEAPGEDGYVVPYNEHLQKLFLRKPGLLVHALDRGTNVHLLRWIDEIRTEGLQTINMLGCHDGIPVLDLRGGEVDGVCRPGLLDDAEIEAVVDRILARGGRIENLYGPDGRRIAYYQVNATFYSVLGEEDRKLPLARAIQLFMPGIPQIWYLDLFAGRNGHVAADNGGAAGRLHLSWRYNGCFAGLHADLKTCEFTVSEHDTSRADTRIFRSRDESPRSRVGSSRAAGSVRL